MSLTKLFSAKLLSYCTFFLDVSVFPWWHTLSALWSLRVPLKCPSGIQLELVSVAGTQELHVQHVTSKHTHTLTQGDGFGTTQCPASGVKYVVMSYWILHLDVWWKQTDSSDSMSKALHLLSSQSPNYIPHGPWRYILHTNWTLNWSDLFI